MRTDQKIIVGVNKFETAETNDTPVFKIDESIQKMQTEKLKALKAKRNNTVVDKCLKTLSTAASGTDNIMPFVVDAVENYCTLGEIADTLRKVYGEYK